MTRSNENKGTLKDPKRIRGVFAMMLIYLVKSVFDNLGQEGGERILKRRLREFGKARGRIIRAKIDSLGLKPTVENFAKYNDFPMFAAWKAAREVAENRRYSKVSFCPAGNFWKERGEKKLD